MSNGRSKYKPKGTKVSLNVSVTEKSHGGTRTSHKPRGTSVKIKTK